MKIKSEQLKQKFIQGQVSVRLHSVQDKDALCDLTNIAALSTTFDAFFPYTECHSFDDETKRIINYTGPRNKVMVFESLDDFCSSEWVEPVTLSMGQGNIHITDDHVTFGYGKYTNTEIDTFIAEYTSFHNKQRRSLQD